MTELMKKFKGNERLAKLFSSKKKKDDVYNLVQNDTLILQYADFQIQKSEQATASDNSESETDMTSEDSDIDVEGDGEVPRPSAEDDIRSDAEKARYVQTMAEVRLLGRYVQTFRKKCRNSDIWLIDTFHPSRIQYFTPTIRTMTKSYTQTASAKKLVAKLGALLTFARSRVPGAELVQSHQLKLEAEVVNARSNITTAVKEIDNPTEDLPRDVVDALKRFVIANLHQRLLRWRNKKFTYATYQELCYYCIVGVTMYNLGRSGAFASVSVAQYKNHIRLDSNFQTPPGVTDKFREFADSIEVILLRGKSEKHQMVLAVITKLFQIALRKVINLREEFVPSTIKTKTSKHRNEHLFALRGSKTSHDRGNKAFEYVSKQLDLNPFVTAGKVRKAMATASVFEEDIRVKKLLASIQGHDLSTHTRIY